MRKKLLCLKKASVSLEPQTYWSAVRHANPYNTKWTGCGWETQKHFHYPTVMFSWSTMNQMQNRKYQAVKVSPGGSLPGGEGSELEQAGSEVSELGYVIPSFRVPTTSVGARSDQPTLEPAWGLRKPPACSPCSLLASLAPEHPWVPGTFLGP